MSKKPTTGTFIPGPIVKTRPARHSARIRGLPAAGDDIESTLALSSDAPHIGDPGISPIAPVNTDTESSIAALLELSTESPSEAAADSEKESESDADSPTSEPDESGNDSPTVI